MNHHELKTDPEAFQLSWEGKKGYEIRLNDRDYKAGDSAILKETRFSGAAMKDGQPLEYTGRVIEAVINSVIADYGIADGWAILNLGHQICLQDDSLSNHYRWSRAGQIKLQAQRIADLEQAHILSQEQQIKMHKKQISAEQERDQLKRQNAIYTTALNNIVGFSSQGDSYAEAMTALTRPTTTTNISTQAVEANAGTLSNLNELIPGAKVKFVGVSAGEVKEIWERASDETANVIRARAWIIHEDGHESYHTYRNDGRSQYNASADITNILPAPAG